MAPGTRFERGGGAGARTAPRWTADDILRDAAETFALLPRPGTAARHAFLTLLNGYWPSASATTRAVVGDLLRASPRVSLDVLTALDRLCLMSDEADWADHAGETHGGTPADPNTPVDPNTPAASGAPTGSTHDETPPVPTLISRAARVRHRDGMRVTATVTGRGATPEPIVQDADDSADEGAVEGAVESADLDPAASSRAAVTPPPLAGPEASLDEAPGPLAEGGVEGDADGNGAAHAPGRAAEHARRVVAQLAREGGSAVPELQPAAIDATLENAAQPGPALARLLDISLARAAAIAAVPRARGTAVALRALGVTAVRAEQLVTRWRGRAPAGFRDAYDALGVATCLDTVAHWRCEDDGTARDDAPAAGRRAG